MYHPVGTYDVRVVVQGQSERKLLIVAAFTLAPQKWLDVGSLCTGIRQSRLGSNGCSGGAGTDTTKTRYVPINWKFPLDAQFLVVDWW